jgi:hypothetical protein
MAVCIVLAAFMGAPATLITPPAQAQTIPGMPNMGGQQGGTFNIGQQVATAIGSGQSTGNITQMIQQAAGGQNIGSSSQISQIVQGLQGGNASPTAISGLVNGLVGGQLPTGAASSMANMPNLGNMNMSQMTNMLNNPSIQSAVGQMGSVGQQAGGLQNIMNIAQNPSAMMNPQNATQMAQTISQAFPAISQALGGMQGVATALSSIGGLMSAFGGAGGQSGQSGQGGQGNEPKSSQDPNNSSHTEAGCHCQECNTKIPQHYGDVRSHTQSEFQTHRNWIVNTFWLENMLPALQLMAEQLTAVGIAQMQMVGAMLDAKHQMETQRLFQEMTARAHKDYQPSEGMCTFGTTVRSLAGSERRSNMAQVAFAARMIQRQAASGDVTSIEGLDSDKRSRMAHFLKNYCDQADNANGLGTLCRQAVPKPERRNIDVDYTRNIESRLTLDVSFIPDPAGGTAGTANNAQSQDEATADEQDVFALAANLFSTNVAPIVPPEDYATKDGRIRIGNVEKYMDMRSVFAKRSVAQNSFAAIVGQRAAGAPESAPYLKAIMKEFGITKPEEINQLIGEKPSYFAQMEVLTKKLYQNPTFYTELYDKPVNVERKGAAMQAIGLMQDRDLYNSLLRSEVVLSVLLETMLQKEQDKVVNEGPKRNPAGGAR